MRTRSRLVGAAAALVALASLPLAPSATAGTTCGTTAAPDEWPVFGRDLSNTRTQAAAGGISTATVPTLTKRWAFTTGAAFGGTADLNGTPIVSGGCVFLNTSLGRILALRLADGAVVWEHDVPIPLAETGLGAGVFISSPVVDDGVLYALVSRNGAPSVIALDAGTGALLHEATIITGEGYYTQATPVISNGVLLAGFSPAEGDKDERGGIALFRLPRNVHSSAPWKRTIVHTIPDADFENPPHYAGGGIWTAPAVDAEHGYAYAGTSNPYSKKVEHPNTNAILKIDIDPARATYGTIVGSYKGLIEQYDENVRDLNQPVCDAIGEEDVAQQPVGDSTACLQLDLDFGAAPNLFPDASGSLLVGDLQKAGVYHAARADTMAPVWKATVGASCAACNAAAWAFVDGALVGASSPVGTEVAIGGADGALRWASPIADGTRYQSTSVAGGVAFTVDNAGQLLAWDVATGVPLLRRPMAADTEGNPAGLASSGVAIAGGLVLAAAGNAVVVYGPA